jgi:hypothetical protein
MRISLRERFSRARAHVRTRMIGHMEMRSCGGSYAPLMRTCLCIHVCSCFVTCVHVRLCLVTCGYARMYASSFVSVDLRPIYCIGCTRCFQDIVTCYKKVYKVIPRMCSVMTKMMPCKIIQDPGSEKCALGKIRRDLIFYQRPQR